LDVIEKSLFSFLADAELVRPLLTAKSSNRIELNELQRELGEAEKQATRIAELILGDDEAPKLLYDRLKLEEARGKQLRSAIDSETMRLKAELQLWRPMQVSGKHWPTSPTTKHTALNCGGSWLHVSKTSCWTRMARIVSGATPCI